VIEEHNLDTVVSGFCVSACAMIFLAGTNRYFGDGEPLALTSLGFHSTYARGGGGAGLDRRKASLKQRVLERTGGKIDPALVDRWLAIEDQRSTVRFRYPDAKATTVFFCAIGHDPNQGRFQSCEGIAGTDALASGIITSTTIYRVH